jgi:hypothetical protein
MRKANTSTADRGHDPEQHRLQPAETEVQCLERARDAEEPEPRRVEDQHRERLNP